jgi:2'-5' RNA ligase
MIRTFVAVSFSVVVTRRIAEEVERQRASVSGVRAVWVPPANFHVTLRFLGSIEEEWVAGLAGRLRTRAAKRSPFDMRAKGLGVFPSQERPRVLWVGVDGGEPLLSLQREVEAASCELGLDPEERPFHPHLTVARVKEGGPIAWQSEVDLGMSQVSEMVIYESRTTSKGSEYTARARVPLGK